MNNTIVALSLSEELILQQTDTLVAKKQHKVLDRQVMLSHLMGALKKAQGALLSSNKENSPTSSNHELSSADIANALAVAAVDVQLLQQGSVQCEAEMANVNNTMTAGLIDKLNAQLANVQTQWAQYQQELYNETHQTWWQKLLNALEDIFVIVLVIASVFNPALIGEAIMMATMTIMTQTPLAKDICTGISKILQACGVSAHDANLAADVIFSIVMAVGSLVTGGASIGSITDIICNIGNKIKNISLAITRDIKTTMTTLVSDIKMSVSRALEEIKTSYAAVDGPISLAKFIKKLLEVLLRPLKSLLLVSRNKALVLMGIGLGMQGSNFSQDLSVVLQDKYGNNPPAWIEKLVLSIQIIATVIGSLSFAAAPSIAKENKIITDVVNWFKKTFAAFERGCPRAARLIESFINHIKNFIVAIAKTLVACTPDFIKRILSAIVDAIKKPMNVITHSNAILPITQVVTLGAQSASSGYQAKISLEEADTTAALATSQAVQLVLNNLLASYTNMMSDFTSSSQQLLKNQAGCVQGLIDASIQENVALSQVFARISSAA
jgi:hypothetical protein